MSPRRPTMTPRCLKMDPTTPKWFKMAGMVPTKPQDGQRWPKKTATKRPTNPKRTSSPQPRHPRKPNRMDSRDLPRHGPFDTQSVLSRKRANGRGEAIRIRRPLSQTGWQGVLKTFESSLSSGISDFSSQRYLPLPPAPTHNRNWTPRNVWDIPQKQESWLQHGNLVPI
jgi:hypothetical protein